jgi:ribose 1,5-bisphosphokinase PhnN
MKRIDLTQEQPSVEELLQFAAVDSVLIRSQKGVEFLLEAADAFDREIAELSRSERFMSFLAERSKEPGRTNLEEIDRRLSLAEQAAQDRS